MPPALIDNLASFTDAHDELQLRLLDETVGSIETHKCGENEIRALLSIFERFPDDDGYGVFWSILHCLEKCESYERLLIESVTRNPVEFSLSMVNRIINSGVSEIDGLSLHLLLESAITNVAASENTKDFARNFIKYQQERNRAET